MARFGSPFDSSQQAIPSSLDPVTVERTATATVTRSQPVAISVLSLVRFSPVSFQRLALHGRTVGMHHDIDG